MVLTGQPGSVRGRVQLAGFNDPERLTRVRVALLAPDADAEAEPAHQAAPTQDGRFLLSDVPPGPWLLDVSYPESEPYRRDLEVPPGGVFPVGTIVLNQPPPPAPARSAPPSRGSRAGKG